MHSDHQNKRVTIFSRGKFTGLQVCQFVTHNASCITFHVLRFTVYALLTILFLPTSSTNAQTQSANYWQYRASGRLEHIITTDMDDDGIDDFIVVDETGQVALLNANGILLHSYNAPGTISAIQIIKTDDPFHSRKEIILGLQNQLILLSDTGSVIWQVPLTPLSTPTDLLTSDSQEAEAAWLSQYEANPVAIEQLDRDGDGRSEILVLLDSGQLQLIDAHGNLIWRYVRNSNPNLKTLPQMAVSDLDQDGQDEIALGIFNPRLRFSQLALIGSDGRLLWDQEQPVSGRLTALTLTQFDNQQQIAIGTNLGHVYVYDANRQRIWFRTINQPVTALTAFWQANEVNLAVATDVGSLVVFNNEGRRQWTRHLAPNADRTILTLSAAPFAPPDNQPALTAVLGIPNNPAEPADVTLLTSNGRTLDTINAVDAATMARLTDINKDQNGELLLARFASLELLGFGIGASELASDWDYGLLGQPRSMVVVDFEHDGEDELVIGTENGRIHRLNNDGSFSWVVNPGTAITHLAALPNPANSIPDVVVIRNNTLPPQPDGSSALESWVALRQANGEQIWENYLLTQINTLEIGRIDEGGRPEIIVGTIDGDVIIYNSAGTEMRRTNLHESVQQTLVIRDNSPQSPYLIATTPHRIYLTNRDAPPWIMALFQEPIQTIYPIGQLGGETTGLLVLTKSNQAYAITLQGRRLSQWPITIDGTPAHSLLAPEPIAEEPLPKDTADSFLISTDAGHLRHMTIEDGQPRLSWLLTGLEPVSSLHWGDLDNDGLPNMALGDENGRVLLYDIGPSARRPELTDRLNLSSQVFSLALLKRENSQRSDLLAITQNGVVQLFRVQENRPPLLTSPEVDVASGRYNLVISVNDVEQDSVTVRLDIFDPATQQWQEQEEQRLNGGNSKLFWSIDSPPAGENGVAYRFHYNDGFHQGYVTPPIGPVPIAPPALSNNPLLSIAVFGISGAILLVIFMRQAQSPVTQARRFYRELLQSPATTLVAIEKRYQRNGGSPDFLLSLANQARQQSNVHISGLADGLFLLANQPRAGMPIIIHTLEEARRYAHPPWQCLARWLQMFTVGRALLEAPSVTELSLLHPQLDHLLVLLDDANRLSFAWETLLAILTNLRDSKRVDLAEDSLVYLNEAVSLLSDFEDELSMLPHDVERPLIRAIVARWSGLVGAEVERLRGRADLAITLKTKRLAPTAQTEVVLEIRNNGRAAAENIIAVLAENPAYLWNGRPQVIPLLPPGRTRQIDFSIEPKVKDRFRLALTLTYNDRNQRDKIIEFGDMVHLLPPTRAFKTIANPYLPGTPLRRDSAMFFGREELFEFIAENAGRLSQRNVLILIGQRRTGKTSLLLRLEQHLPANLLPVYIDCQSLGVTPGMPALLHDLAWHVVDALATKGIELDVPEPKAWEGDPTRFFQRQFLPQAQSLLPKGTMLTLVFDEFEAFENLVQDGILPPTLFPYMRHLMQHSEGLSFIFVGTRRLEEMSADYWSVLFNIALYQKIGYLSDNIARRLIQEPVAPNLVYDDLAIDKILRVTAGHPYFLQLVCYTLVRRANHNRQSYVTINDVNTALDEMLSLGEVHFAYLWQRSTHEERALLTAVSQMMDREMSFHPADMTQYLGEYGIHLTPAEVTAALGKLVERDILQEITEGTTALYELKVGLVGLWVARQKSLSHLYT